MLKMRATSLLVLSLVLLSFAQIDAYAGTINLGNAASFAVLAGSTVTNTGSSIIDGNLGLWPGTAVTGFPPGIVNGTIYAGDMVAMQAQSALTAAYNVAAGLPCNENLSGQNLGGLTLTPGVYCFDSSAQLTGTLTLNSEGNPDAFFLFQVGSTLTTASNSSVDFVNGGQGGSLFWQIGSSATLGTDTAFAGSILALTSITLDTSATISCGRALARNGAVTLDSNFVSINSAGCQAAITPEPSSLALLAMGLLAVSGLFLCRLRVLRSAR